MGDGRASAREQFASRGRYTVVPRVLVFLRYGDAVLLLKGAPTKRLWANRYNGLGGHVEAGETVEAAARREVLEEAGIREIDELQLRALVNLAGESSGVLLCVFTGWARSRAVVASAEGQPEWVPLARLAEFPVVDEPPLLPRIFDTDRLLYGWQRYDAAGRLLDSLLE